MITGYCITTSGEAKRYLRDTLNCLKKLCDEVVIVHNKSGAEEIAMVEEFGFDSYADNAEWGLHQHEIKERLMKWLSHKPRDLMICLDSDEVLLMEKKEIQELKGDAWYVYIMNFWGDGWKRKWSFFNVRIWRWNGLLAFERRPLHCGLAPRWCYEIGQYIPVILEHYGLMLREDRQKKIDRYLKYDPNAQYRSRDYYNGLKDDDFDHINYEHIYQALHKEVDNCKAKKFNIKKPMKYTMLRNPAGRLVDIPENQVAETLKRKGFSLVKEEVRETPTTPEITQPEADLSVPEPIINPLACPNCDFIAKTEKGLKIHSKKHK